MTDRPPDPARLARLAAVLLLAATATAQEPQPVGPPGPEPAAPSHDDPPRTEQLDNGLRLAAFEIPGAAHQTAWLALPWPAGLDPALRLVIVEALRDVLPDPVPTAPVEISAARDVLLVGVTAAAGDSDAATAAILEPFGRIATLEATALEFARDRALLRADDLDNVLPGPLLRDRARRAVGSDAARSAARAAAPERIRDRSAASIRAALIATLRPRDAVLTVIGAIADPDRLRRAAAAVRAAGDAAAPTASAESPADEPAIGPHPLVNAPFVVAAVPAPRWGDGDFLPFLVGVEAVRTRAWRTLRPDRGGEFKADFPPLAYDFTEMPELLFVGRRGRDGDDVARVREELESFLAGVRTRALTVEDVGSAIRVLREHLRLPPFEDPQVARAARVNPAYLHQRGRVLTLVVVHGWPRDLFAWWGTLPLGSVQEALLRRFAADRLRFFALHPAD